MGSWFIMHISITKHEHMVSCLMLKLNTTVILAENVPQIEVRLNSCIMQCFLKDTSVKT